MDIIYYLAGLITGSFFALFLLLFGKIDGIMYINSTEFDLHLNTNESPKNNQILFIRVKEEK